MSQYKINSVLYWILAVILSIVPFYKIVINGIYRWHITQPEVYEGALELGIFILAAVMGSLLFKAEAIILFAFLLYLTKQGVIIPVITDYLYLEIISYIGFTFSGLLKAKREYRDSIIWNFISGCSTWGMFAIIASALGYGKINNLRILTVLLFGASLIINRNSKYHFIFQKIRLFYQREVLDKKSKISFILIIFVLAALCAKSNTALDYDSIWYGLRPEKVLIGPNSFYDYLGYTSFVHYYPKLMEILYLPISELGDYSFIICMNIWCLVLILILIYNMFSWFDHDMKISTKLFFVLLFCTIPSVANIATTAKSDILGCFLVLCASYYAICYLKGKQDASACAYISLLLCTGTKPTYLLWGGIVFLMLTASVIARLIKGSERINTSLRNLKLHSIEMVMSIVFVLGIHARTVILTGYPIYPVGIDLWSKIGFSARNYALKTSNSLMNEDFDFFYRIYQFIINPTELPHVIMLWPSNICVFMILVLLINNRNIFKKQKNIFLLIPISILSLISVTLILTMRNPDGNYFIFPTIFVTILILYLLEKASYKIEKIGFLHPLQLLLIINMIIMFISHPSWAYGTKSFNCQIICDNFDSAIRNKVLFDFNGIGEIANYLQDNLSDARIISSVMQDASVPRRIQSRIETIDMIGSPYFNDGSIMTSYFSFKKYLRDADIQGFIISNNESTIYKEYTDTLISEGNATLIVSDISASLYLITSH